METFRDDNTEGFTAEQLAWANAQWLERYPEVDPESDEGKHYQALILDEAAQVWDALLRAPRLALVGQYNGFFVADTLRIGKPVLGRLSSHHNGEYARDRHWWANHGEIADMREAYTDSTVSTELLDAASGEGLACLAYVDRDGSGRPQVVLGGCTSPEMIRAFVDHWAPSQGLVDAYGDSQRGFAGAYLPTETP